jgi:hypothetical protein
VFAVEWLSYVLAMMKNQGKWMKDFWRFCIILKDFPLTLGQIGYAADGVLY